MICSDNNCPYYGKDCPDISHRESEPQACGCVFYPRTMCNGTLYMGYTLTVDCKEGHQFDH